MEFPVIAFLLLPSAFLPASAVNSLKKICINRRCTAIPSSSPLRALRVLAVNLPNFPLIFAAHAHNHRYSLHVRKLFQVLTVLLLAATVATGAAFAHGGKSHLLLGIVKELREDHLVVKATDGHESTVRLTKATVYEKDKKPATRAALMAGARVSVQLTEDNKSAVKVKIGGQVMHTVSEGDGPVNALDGALRKALLPCYPRLAEMHLADYKVRVVNARAETAARVRVVIEWRDGDAVWGTVGVSANIIAASWQALADSFEYKLFRDEEADKAAD